MWLPQLFDRGASRRLVYIDIKTKDVMINGEEPIQQRLRGKAEGGDVNVEEQVTFAELAPQYDVVRGVTKVKNGRKDSVLISYVKTRAGEIERQRWQSMVRELIRDAGEEDLFQHLVDWTMDHAHWLRTERDRENYALELHASRIFDDEKWVGFVPFNRMYRPERLASAGLVSVTTECCGKECITTLSQIESGNGVICCPYCGRFSAYFTKD